MNAFFAVCTLLYSLFLLAVERGSRLLAKQSSVKKPPDEAQQISVIIAARNELQNLPNLLESLSKLDYPPEYYEIILVNDHSNDGSSEFLQQHNCPNLHVIEFTSSLPLLVGKKAALQIGIEAARFDLLAFTDADCLVPGTWLSEINRVMDTETDYLLSYSVMQHQIGGSIFRLKNFERSIYYALAAAGLYYRVPITSSACNMVYRKSLFLASGAFAGIGHLASGDDDLLLMKMMPKLRKSAYNPSIAMQVVSIDGTDAKKHHHTNIRRASKFRYHPWYLKALSAFVFVYFAFFYRSLWQALLGKATPLLKISLLIKTSAEFFLAQRHLQLIGRAKLGILYPLQILFFPAQFLFYALRGTLGKYRWK